MPILKNAKKALRQSKKRAQVNLLVKSNVRGAIKRMRTNPSVDQLKLVFRQLDLAVKSHVLHRNAAARHKSRLNALLAKRA